VVACEILRQVADVGSTSLVEAAKEESMRKRFLALLGTVIAVIVVSATASANTPVNGAAFTTTNTNKDGTGHCKNGNEDVNCNIYDGKEFVWLNGGPDTAYVGDGDYFFAVLEPGGQGGGDDPNDLTPKNLSDDFDTYANRTFSVAGGTISYGGSHDFDSNKIRLMPYADTSNPGGVYILAICSLADTYPVDASDCKYDAFKIKKSDEVIHPGADLSIAKDADGSNTNTFTWGITKAVDKTIVHQVGGSVTFNYTVTVQHDGGAIGDVKVAGTITVTNPNVDASNGNATLPVDITGVSDELSDGTICDVTDGGAQTLVNAITAFSYECDLGALPTGQLDNTATVEWGAQFLDDGSLLEAGSADFPFSNIQFAENTVDECVNVTDTYAGTLGTACVGEANPKSFNYSRTIAVPQFGCLSYDNTATFTTNDTGATGSASKTVTVCGPARTGGLTMGFWQNKNGQAIISGGAALSGVCKSGTWLRQYAPFQDLSATASCSAVATYVYNVIKAATAKGAAMNAMLKAQMLATALDVYFSDPALGLNKINAPAPIGGVYIDLALICKMIDASTGTATCAGIYRDTSAAFTVGGTPKCQTVGQLLAYAASKSNSGGGTWYAQVKATQELAKDTFDAINNQVAFSCSP
jgi:hypothetical protein